MLRDGSFPPLSTALLRILECQGRRGVWGEGTFGEPCGDRISCTCTRFLYFAESFGMVSGPKVVLGPFPIGKVVLGVKLLLEMLRRTNVGCFLEGQIGRVSRNIGKKNEKGGEEQRKPVPLGTGFSLFGLFGSVYILRARYEKNYRRIPTRTQRGSGGLPPTLARKCWGYHDYGSNRHCEN